MNKDQQSQRAEPKNNENHEVDLGSGVKIPIEAAKFRGNLLYQKPKKGPELKNIPAMHAKHEEFIVDGETYKVERSLLRYESLEDVVDELPDFIKEILDK